ncbi:MAG: cytochrome ubiquinol oxidase subunit [Ilumatobacteraceae bacterium]|nr:cytochrome ubiquinol oxidase subunit [Ilumatobacteraceae bacterium]
MLAVSASQLLAARDQMALSLGFHIVLSCFGVAFPTLIYIVHRRGLRGDADALLLAKRWSKVAAVLFAVGAVSGTVLSFEMGLLWPGLMSRFGDVVGLPFALEGIAFFVEAIFLGIYLYGWNKLPPKVHLRTLVPMMAAGVVGTFCVVAVNAWMNSPSGFHLVTAADGTQRITDVQPLTAMFNNAVWTEFLHMFVAAYMVVGFLAAAVYASGMLKGRRDRVHRLGFTVAFAVASVGALVQPLIGHIAGMRLAEHQPVKLAAMELATTTEKNAPLRIGGILIDGTVRAVIEIPGISSLLARGWFDRPVPGLDQVPKADQPPANVVHNSFQIMVGIGTALLLFAVFFWWRRRRNRGTDRDLLTSRRFLRLAVIAGPLAVIALESGWTTTEVGRQPWIVQGVLRVKDAVTPNGGIWFSFTVIAIVYAGLATITSRVLRSMSRRWRENGEVDLPTPYGPPSDDPNPSGRAAGRRGVHA